MHDRDARLAVGLHGIEPATFEHCALIREWLTDLGVGRVTLCLAPQAAPTPLLTAWLQERRGEGDAVVTDTAARGEEPFGLLRAALLRARGTLQIDVHPQDFDRHPGRTRALERTLRRAAARRRAVTLDEPAIAEARLRADAPRVLRAP